MQRYAVYYTPEGALGAAGAAWLGWDITRGCPALQPSVDGLDLAHLTESPRRYGFHATIKPPFVLSPGASREKLEEAFETLCAKLPSLHIPALEPVWMGGFFALTALGGDPSELTALAAKCVSDLDAFRAPLSAEEFARRDHVRLSEAARSNLRSWGYPHVMESFRFHLTLTGRVPRSQRAVVESAVAAQIVPALPSSLVLSDLTLVGQGADGFFREIHRAPLQG